MPALSLTPAQDILAACTKVVLAPAPRTVVVYTDPAPSTNFVPAVANKLREHYVAAEILERWNRKKVADFLVKKTPASLVGKSGDLGEIVATEVVNAGHLGSFSVPINRLRWKDSKELPMRGDDLIGIAFDEEPIRFLKGEAKSRRKLLGGVLGSARKALEKNNGLPLSHTLAFLVERLYEQNDDAKAEQVEPYLLDKIPTQSQVTHLIFTFSGNDPSKLLIEEIKSASKKFARASVGLCVPDHSETINEIFVKATGG